MPVLEFPQEAWSAIKCADWLELGALTAPECRSSIATVERNLRRLSLYEETGTIEQLSRVDVACDEVLGEISRRVAAAAEGYPFTLKGTELALAGDPLRSCAYTFCLCLSWFGWNPRRGNRVFPRRMFEDLSKHAAEAFVGGQALRFGAPRADLPKSFKEALLRLCIAIGEGQVRTTSRRARPQDDTLDLIAWRDFPDRSEGKLFLVGQCASGANWEAKKRELDAEAFFDEWFSDRPPSVRVMRIGLFIPHRVPRDSWVPITRRAGIIFDRCRIAYLSHNNPNFTNRAAYVEWCAETLARVKAQ